MSTTQFMTVEDLSGHHAGDVVIRKMAEIVKKNTPSSDLLARFGGDEFIMLITSTTEEQAASIAEKIREMIASTDMAIPGMDVPLRITISGGVAMFPTHGQSTTELFRVADEALYESKRNGRNRILVASPAGLHAGIHQDKEAGLSARIPENIPDDHDPGLVEFALGEPGGNLRD